MSRALPHRYGAARHVFSKTARYHAADVLAGAYRGRGRNMGPRDNEALVHAVEVDEQGTPIRVLCSSVKLDHLITDADRTDRTPTCPRCAARLARLGAHTVSE